MFYLILIATSFSPRHGNPVLECWDCAEELSIQSYVENGNQKRIDDFLGNWCKVRLVVPRDGHCICSSWLQVRLATLKDH